MKVLRQIGILFSICVVGDVIASFLPVPFPGSVIAMVILFVLLCIGLIKEKNVDSVADFLTKNMTIMFIPATVSIIEHTQILKSVLWKFLLICFVTTVICFICTAYSVKVTMYIMKRIRERGKKNA